MDLWTPLQLVREVHCRAVLSEHGPLDRYGFLSDSDSICIATVIVTANRILGANQ